MYKDLISTALSFLREGKTILYPTDTIWGIGCDATDRRAVERIYSIKKRNHSKSMLVLATREMLVSSLSDEAVALLNSTDRPTTVILPQTVFIEKMADNLPAADGTIGVRLPQTDFCVELLTQFGHPIVSTSANLSGDPSPATFYDISEAIKHSVDYCPSEVPIIRNNDGISSRIVKVEPSGKCTIIRE